MCHLHAFNRTGDLLLKGSCPDGGSTLLYTLDGSKPIRGTASMWPATGVLTLPGRGVALNAKCFPAAASVGGVVSVESPVAGGIYLSR